MRIHTSTLDEKMIRDAVPAGVTIEALSTHGSRKRARAYEIGLGGSSKHGGQYGAVDYKTATWDEYGLFLANLFAIDPALTIPRVYEDAEHFHWATGDRYNANYRITAITSTSEQHLRHKWGYAEVVGNRYSIHECPGCGATKRNILHGYSWSDIQGVYA